MRRWAAAMVVTAWIGPWSAAAPPAMATEPAADASPAQASPADAVHVLYLGQGRPLVIRVAVLIDGVGFRSAFNGYVQKLFTRLDADGNGSLDAAEGRGIPNVNAWLGNNGRDQGGAPLRNENVDVAPADGLVTLDELKSYLDRQGVSSVIANFLGGRATAAGSYGLQSVAPGQTMIVEYLDTDGNGKLSAVELESAARSLALRDLDDDGTFNTSELAPLGDPFGQRGLQMGSAGAAPASLPFVVLGAELPAAKAVERLLDQFDAGEGSKDHRLSRDEVALPAERFDRWDRDGDGLLDFDELSSMLADPQADLELTVSIGQNESSHAAGPQTAGHPLVDSSTADAQVRISGDGLATVVLNGVQIEVVSPQEGDGSSAMRTALLQQFNAADGDLNDYLEAAEIRQSAISRDLFGTLDRDGNGRVFRSELDQWLDESEAAGSSRVTLDISDQGRNLFEILDTNRDGRLASRELTAARYRLALWDADGDGALSPAIEIPKHYRLAFRRGASVSLPFATGPATGGLIEAGSAAQGPSWFGAMDRNADGEIAPREFLGSAEQFAGLDANSDGFVGPSEALAAQPRR